MQREASVSGIGLFTGEKVSLKILPAPSGSGIAFRRMDLTGQPIVAASASNVCDTTRSTRLGLGECKVSMVEHLLSALSACGIDNALLEINGSEVPACDGSAQVFVDLIEKAGIQVLNEPRRYFEVKKPIFWSDREAHLIALPCSDFKISYTLHYPGSNLLGSQYFSFLVTPEAYRGAIAPCRTFSLYEEIAPLIENGFIKGGGLDNAVVIKNDRVLNPGGIRFPDEMVRHKILDLIGDLSLIGCRLKAHVIAIRSGHSGNVAFAKEILNHFLKVA